MQYYTLEEIKEHNTTESIWVILDDNVYDLSKFLFEHPGGEEVLMDRAGRDGTDCFDSVGHTLQAKAKREEYKIGEVIAHQRKDASKAGPSTDPNDYDYASKKKPVNIFIDYIVPGAVILISFYIYFFVM